MLAEAALAAVAEAIIATAGGELVVGSAGRALRDRVHGDPHQRAVCTALRSALVRFEDAYPRLRDALFDEHFLTRRGAPLLARYLAPGERPRPEELADEWSRQFPSATDRYPGDEVTGAARDFLVWFEEALRSQNALRPVLDSRAADETANAAAWIVEHFAGQLARAFIDPQPLYRELALERFTGREWLLQEVAAFLGRAPSGCLVIEGGPGLGKSTFLAWLARERGYAQHFVRLASGRDDTTAALSNIAAQLAAEWELDAPLGILGPDVRPHEFQRLLEQVARTRDERRPHRRIVVVIDGLNEAAAPPAGQNVLGLPRTLPRAVYLVVSQQPGDVPLNISPRAVCTLSGQDERHLEDLAAYLRAAVERPRIAAALRAGGASAAQLVQALLLSSGGVWLYVHYLLEEIERGERALDALGDLPFGLWQYYEDRRRRRLERARERWEPVEGPLLATLAAAQEPLTPTRLRALAGLASSESVGEFIGGWEPYLQHVEGDEHRYRVYHESLRAFLRGDAVTGLHRGEQRIAEQLASATLRAHNRIAERYLDAWGGLEGSLPRLRDDRCRELDAGYGIRHLAAHLEAAGRDEELRELLQVEWPGEPRPVSAWYTAHAQTHGHAGYLSDLARAWRLAETATDRAIECGQEAPGIGDEVGCALLTASINSQLLSLPPALRAGLLRHSVWTTTQAIADAYQIPDAEARADALTALLSNLAGDDLERAAEDALAAALAISDQDPRAYALTALAPHLAGDERDQALEEALVAATAIGDEDVRADALADLAPHLAGEQLERALAAAGAIGDERRRARALAALAPHLADHELERALHDALIAAGLNAEDWRDRGRAALASDRGDEFGRALQDALAIDGFGAEERADALAALAPHLADDQLERAVTAARTIGSGQLRVRALAALVPHLASDQRGRALEDALATAGEIGDERQRADALTALAPYLVGDERDRALMEALAAATAIRDKYVRADALAGLAPHLAGEQLEQALEDALAAADAIADHHWRARALTALTPHLAGEQLEQALENALAAAAAIGDDRQRAWALDQVAPYLAGEQLSKAVIVAREIRDTEEAMTGTFRHAATNGMVDIGGIALAAVAATSDEHRRARALRALARHLAGERLDQAVAVAGTIGNESDRVYVLAALIPHLAGDQLEHALENALDAAAAIPYGYIRADALAALAPHLARDQLDRALAVAGAIGDESPRANALAALAPQLVGDQLDRALAAVGAIGSGQELEHALTALLPRLTGGQVDQALKVVSSIDNAYWRARALGKLAPHLASHDLERALAVAAEIGDESPRAEALAALAPHLSGDQRERALKGALAAAGAIAIAPWRVEALAGLAPHLAGDKLDRALVVASAIDDERWRINALVALAPQLTGDQVEQALQDALAAADAIGDERRRVQALGALAPHLAGSQLERALAAARAISDETLRADALAELAPQLAGDQLHRALEAALAAAGNIGDEPSRAEALAAVAPHLAGDQLEHALAVARAIGDKQPRAEALAALAPHLAGEQREHALADALATASGIGTERSRVEVLAALVPHLAGDQLRHALETALVAASEISHEHSRAQALVALVPHLAGDLLERALGAAGALGAESARRDVLGALVSRLASDQMNRALAVTGAIGHEHARADALDALAPYLTADELEEALVIARALAQPSARLKALRALTSQRERSQAIDARSWRDLLTTAAVLGRRDVHDISSIVLPLVRDVGGPEALSRTITWLGAALRWWP